MNSTFSINTPLASYLERKGVSIIKGTGSEIVARCPFSVCDNDSKHKEAHFYINQHTAQYQCKKCGEKGNIWTLAKHFHDEAPTIVREFGMQECYLGTAKTPPRIPSAPRASKYEITDALVSFQHEALTAEARKYLRNRLITDDFVSTFQLGLYKERDGTEWISIPVKDQNGKYAYLKQRRMSGEGNRYRNFPSGCTLAPYSLGKIEDIGKPILFEGELDALAFWSQGIPEAVGIPGAENFKEEWVGYFKNAQEVTVCYDWDEAGRNGARKMIAILRERFPDKPIFQIERPGDFLGKDPTEYLQDCQAKGQDIGEAIDTLLISSRRSVANEGLSSLEYGELSMARLDGILGKTIKGDHVEKIITFLTCLSAYTQNDQLNTALASSSSTGKSYLINAILEYFPQSDIVRVDRGNFLNLFNTTSNFSQEEAEYRVKLAGKIVVFNDAEQMTKTLKGFRSLLSHDQREYLNVTTNGRGKTVKTRIMGHPAVCLATADFSSMDRQEATRFILLSPREDEEKLEESIRLAILRGSNGGQYMEDCSADPERISLMERISSIKCSGVSEIVVSMEDAVRIERSFLDGKKLQMADSRNVSKLFGMIKAIALLNLWTRRKLSPTQIEASSQDVEEGMRLWLAIGETQGTGISPKLFRIYKEVILACHAEAVLRGEGELGLKKGGILKKYQEVYGSSLVLREYQEKILPTLESANMIRLEKDPADNRARLLFPVHFPDQKQVLEKEIPREGAAVGNISPEAAAPAQAEEKIEAVRPF